MIAGQLEIQLMANMARLVSDMDKAKNYVDNAVGAMNQILGMIGVGLSFSGLSALAKGVADSGDKLNDLRKITGMTVNELGGLDKMAKLNGTDLDSVAKGVGNMAKNMSSGNDVFKLMGVNIRDTNGNLRNANQVLLDVAGKFERYEDGAAKSALANELFGKAGRDLIPLLSEGRAKLEEAAEAHRKYSGWTNESAEMADKFNDEMTILQGRVAGVKNRFVIDLLPTLTDITSAFVSATERVNGFSLSGNLVSPILKGMAHAGYLVFDVFNGVARSVGGALARVMALATFDYQKYVDIGQHVDELNEQSRASYDAFVDSLYNGDKALQETAASQGELNKQQKEQAPTLGKTAAAQKDATTEAQRFIEALQKEARESGVTGTALTRLRAEYLGVSGAAEEYIQEIERKNRAQRLEEMATQDIVKGLERYKKLNEDTKTALEKYQDQVRYINEARDATDGTAISQETYNRALKKAQEEFDKTRDTGKSALSDLDQYAIQAARNIQTSLANFLFDPFNNGLKGMVTGVANAVRRMASEFAALKISQSLGLQQLFGGIVGSGGGSSSSGGSSSGSSLLSIAGMGSNLMSMISGGFGMNSLIGSGLTSIGGSGLLGSFGAGLSGGSSAAAFIGAESATAGAGMAAGLGASLGAIAGPAAIAAAVDMGLRTIFGNKKLGGVAGDVLGYVPIVGTLINGLFGRGPLEQKETQLTGDVGSNGFLDAYLTTNFKAKGGLFSGSKHDFAGVNLMTGAAETDNGKLQGVADSMVEYAQQLAQQINNSVGAVNTSLRSLSDTLGLSTQPLDDYRHSINLISESGKALTDEQIAQEIADISDEMVKSILPNVEEFAKSGETSIQTLSRLSNEFSVLTSAASLLFDKSADWSKAFVSSFGYADRTAFIDKAGGSDAFSSMVSGFAQNFLTDDQRMKPVIESLISQRDDNGLNSINTRAQYVSAVQSGNLSEDQLIFLLKNQDTIKSVFDYIDQKNSDELQSKAQAQAQAQAQDFGNIYNNIANSFNQRIQDITDSIEKLKNFSQELLGSVEQLQPMSRNEALQQLLDYATAAENGADLPDISTLKNPISTLTNMDVNDYSSQLDYARARAQSVSAINTLISISSDKQDLLVASIESLKESMATNLSKIAGFTEQTADILDTATGGGGPLLTQQA
ncbi:MAG: hypothetical protein JSR71_09390 [Proteobacteria bacterium]|nr:hypothetical protein [Pseudomonadota bacterium]